MTKPLSILARPHWLAALLLCSALTACGGDNGNDPVSSGPGTPGNATEAPNNEGGNGGNGNGGNGNGEDGNQPNQPPAAKPNLRCAP